MIGGEDLDPVRIRDDMPEIVDITDGDPGIDAPVIIGIPASEWDPMGSGNQPPIVCGLPESVMGTQGTGLPEPIIDPSVICPRSRPKKVLTTRETVEVLVVIISGIILVIYIIKSLIEAIVRAVSGKKDNGGENGASK